MCDNTQRRCRDEYECDGEGARVEEKTKLTGYGAVADIKKGDKVSGKYIVTPDGKYIATALSGE